MAEQAVTILIVDDEARIRQSLIKILSREGFAVVEARNGEEALDALRARTINAVLCDLRMPVMNGMEFLRAARAMAPETEVIVTTGYGTVETAVEAMKIGAYDFVEKPFKRAQLLRTLHKALERQTLLFENRRLKETLASVESGSRNVIGNSRAMRRVVDLVAQIADSTATVLITGESGSGKEVIANAIHFHSPRQAGPFVKVSCAALPETLLEAELFGYEKGAFTGATHRKAGRFELADRGTLFMDEVGEIPTAMQVKLLRVLQEGEFERLGGVDTLSVDVRVVAATNRKLEDLVEEGGFREDLYYRLNVINVEIPPLRDRRDDIPLFVAHFIQRYAERNKRQIAGVTDPAMDALMRYQWPGNVRELENAIERAIVLSRTPMIGVEVLPAAVAARVDSTTEIAIPVGMKLSDVESKVIEATLDRTGGNREVAAQMLGISSRTIYRKVRPQRTGVEPDDDEPADVPEASPPS